MFALPIKVTLEEQNPSFPSYEASLSMKSEPRQDFTTSCLSCSNLLHYYILHLLPVRQNFKGALSNAGATLA